MYLGSTRPRSRCRTPRRSTIETAPTAVWQTTARSPTSSIARGSATVRIERRTRNEPRSTTASRASASHVTSADGSGAIKAARSPNGAAAVSARNSDRFTLSLRPRARQGSRPVRSPALGLPCEPPGALERAGLRRSRLRASRADARRGRRSRRPRRRRGRAGRNGRVGRQAPADVRGRRAGALLRSPRLRAGAATALRRASLGARRGAQAGRRQLAGARGAAVLHRDARRSARRQPAPPLPHGGAARDRHRRRVARRHDPRRRGRRRLPARGARAQPRRAHARHRRDDPDRPVPADHGRPDAPARDPGRAGHRQDRRRAAPRLVPALHAPRHPGAPRRPRDRPEPDVHGVRLARAAGARRERGRAARGLGARRRRRAGAARPAAGRGAEGRPAAWPRSSGAPPTPASSRSRSSSSCGSKARSSPCGCARCASCSTRREPRTAPPRSDASASG